MNEDLFVRVAGSIGSIAILLVAITVGALLGDDPDEIFALSMVCVVILSISAIIIIYHFRYKVNSLH